MSPHSPLPPSSFSQILVKDDDAEADEYMAYKFVCAAPADCARWVAGLEAHRSYLTRMIDIVVKEEDERLAREKTEAETAAALKTEEENAFKLANGIALPRPPPPPPPFSANDLRRLQNAADASKQRVADAIDAIASHSFVLPLQLHSDSMFGSDANHVVVLRQKQVYLLPPATPEDEALELRFVGSGMRVIMALSIARMCHALLECVMHLVL